jgi:predicted SAM-dependent methyltransferase
MCPERPKGIYVQYGCGFVAPDDWVNFDSSLTLGFERIPLIGLLYSKNGNRFPRNVRFGNVSNGLPIPDQSCAGVYACHVLEHLSRKGFASALTNTYRMLKPGGIFRLVVPDLEEMARVYLRLLDEGIPNASEQFLGWTQFCIGERIVSPVRIIRNLLSNGHHHWMYDYAALQSALGRYGFTSVRRCCFHDCQDATFTSVEHEGRFKDALSVECMRPSS